MPSDNVGGGGVAAPDAPRPGCRSGRTPARLLEIREEGNRIVAAGRLRIRGKRSGALTEWPFGWVGDFENGKSVCIRTSLDPNDPRER